MSQWFSLSCWVQFFIYDQGYFPLSKQLPKETSYPFISFLSRNFFFNLSLRYVLFYIVELSSNCIADVGLSHPDVMERIKPRALDFFYQINPQGIDSAVMYPSVFSLWGVPLNFKYSNLQLKCIIFSTSSCFLLRVFSPQKS